MSTREQKVGDVEKESLYGYVFGVSGPGKICQHVLFWVFIVVKVLGCMIEFAGYYMCVCAIYGFNVHMLNTGICIMNRAGNQLRF